jgi:hypothetical protein
MDSNARRDATVKCSVIENIVVRKSKVTITRNRKDNKRLRKTAVKYRENDDSKIT